MKEINFYRFIIGGLLLLNIGIIAFFLLYKPNRPHSDPHTDFRSIVVKILHLNAEQEATFREMAKQHQDKMVLIDKRERELIFPYFQSLSDTTIYLNEEQVLNEFKTLEKEKLMVTHQHFKDIKSILKEGQLPYFKDITNKFIHGVILKNNKKPPPPKDFH